jgi:hypothetical protein
MPAILDLDLDTQNICCETVLKILKDKQQGLPLTYRSLIKDKVWDSYCKEMGIATPQEAYYKLDEPITVSFDTLSKLNYKYKCSALCMLPTCLDDLSAWEFELIENWKIIEDVVSWIEIGMTLTKVSAWHGIPIDSIRRWNSKRKRIADRAEIYKNFQNYIHYLPAMVK